MYIPTLLLKILFSKYDGRLLLKIFHLKITTQMVTSSYHLDTYNYTFTDVTMAGWQTVPVYNTASLYRCTHVFYLCT